MLQENKIMNGGVYDRIIQAAVELEVACEYLYRALNDDEEASEHMEAARKYVLKGWSLLGEANLIHNASDTGTPGGRELDNEAVRP